MTESNDRKDLERRLERAKRMAALPVPPDEGEAPKAGPRVRRTPAVVGLGAAIAPQLKNGTRREAAGNLPN